MKNIKFVLLSIVICFLLLFIVSSSTKSVVEVDMANSGTNITDFWSNYDVKNLPTANITNKGVITSDRTNYYCVNGFCEVFWAVNSSNKDLVYLIGNIGETYFVSDSLLFQKTYVFMNVSFNVIDNKSEKVSLVKHFDWVPIEDVVFNLDDVEGILFFKTKVFVKNSDEFDIVFGDLFLDPVFNYSNYRGFKANFFDNTINSSWWVSSVEPAQVTVEETGVGFVVRSSGGGGRRSNTMNSYNFESVYSDTGKSNVTVNLVAYMRFATSSIYGFYIQNLDASTLYSDDCGGNSNQFTGDCANTRMVWSGTGDIGAARLVTINVTFDMANRLVYCKSSYSNNGSFGSGGQGCADEVMGTASVSSVFGFTNFTVGEPFRVGFKTYASTSEYTVNFTSFNISVNGLPESNVPPSIPVWSDPVNGSVFYFSSFVVNWSNSTDGNLDSVSYDFQFDDDVLFGSLFIDNVSVVETSSPTSLFVDGLVDDGEYFMRVRGDDGIVVSNWSVNRSVFVFIKPNVTLNYPVDFSNESVITVFNCTAVSVSDGGVVSNVSLLIDGVVNFTKSGSSDVVSFEVSRNVSDGGHNFSCIATDSFNFNRSVVEVNNFTVDNVDPVSTVVAWRTDDPVFIYSFGTVSTLPVSCNVSCSDGVNSTGCFSIYYCVDSVDSCYPDLVADGVTVNFSSTGTEYFRYFSQDFAGNNGSVESGSVIINPVADEGSSSSGGGGGGSTTKIIIRGNFSWSFTNDRGGDSYIFELLQGDSRRRDLLLRNLGEDEVTVMISCEDKVVFSGEGLCDHVTLGNTSVFLPVSKTAESVVSFELVVPEGFPDGIYESNIVGDDGGGGKLSVTINARVGELGFFGTLFNKLLGTRIISLRWLSADAPDLPVPNLILGVLFGLFVGLFLNYVVFVWLLKREVKSGSTISLLVGFVSVILFLIVI